MEAFFSLSAPPSVYCYTWVCAIPLGEGVCPINHLFFWSGFIFVLQNFCCKLCLLFLTIIFTCNVEAPPFSGEGLQGGLWGEAETPQHLLLSEVFDLTPPPLFVSVPIKFRQGSCCGFLQPRLFLAGMSHLAPAGGRNAAAGGNGWWVWNGLWHAPSLAAFAVSGPGSWGAASLLEGTALGCPNAR